jgi:Uma2 family endonuclease
MSRKANDMIALPKQLEERVFLKGVSWETYQSLRSADENYHLRMTYDRGALEIVSPSRKHEQISYLIGRMIDQWTLLHKIDVAAGRNTTFSRQDLDRGLEPDNCYWIRHQQQISGKDEVDLQIDPPPDLVLEVDVTRSAIPKLPIYAALRVPEVWHWQYDSLQALRLSREGEYRESKGSVELRRFPLLVAAELLVGREAQSDTVIISQFIKSIRAQRRK